MWIIGASFGIGRALSENLATLGANLILSGRTEKALEELKTLLPGKGHGVSVLDVGSEESLSKSFNNFAKEQLEIDCIIYCAGTYQPGPFSEGSALDFEQTLDTNFMGAVRLLRVMESHYSKNKPCQIVFIGSVAAYSGLPNSNIY
ncbi:MAG: SDR family NAD(P)-dependent oxidoreductase, partial [Holosporales bacterium]